MRIPYQHDSPFISTVKLLAESQRTTRIKMYPRNKKKDKRKELFFLRDIVKKNKVKLLTKNFVSKLSQNNTYRKPPPQEVINLEQQYIVTVWNSFIIDYLKAIDGFLFSNSALVIWNVIHLIQTIIMIFILSILTGFDQTNNISLFFYIKVISVIFYIIDLILNFTIQKHSQRKQCINLYEIGCNYLAQGLTNDVLTIIIFIIDLAISTNISIILLLLTLIKFWNSSKKFEKYQHLLIDTTQKSHYFGLLKVIITNFVIGHFLSIILNLMTTISQHNWYSKLNIQQQSWIVKYIWGYYWGTNIMLTVGFGDISASNHIQALILIFVETFSCITLAYNISHVGFLISQIKANNDAKIRKLKIFRKMCKQSQISQQLEQKINNFVEQSFQIKQAFNFHQQDQFLQSLPKTIQSQYRKEANNVLFHSLGYLSNLSKKTLLSLAQTINRKITHPQQIFKKKGQFCDFNVLQKGQIGLVYRNGQSIMNGFQIQKFKVSNNQKPKVLSLDFIKRKKLNYDIKSNQYSIMFYLDSQTFQQVLKNSQIDYQLFRTLKDRSQNMVDQNQLYRCSICINRFHNKFSCSKLHYIPFKSKIIELYLKKSKTIKQKRNLHYRQKSKYKTLKYRKPSQQNHQRYIETFYGQQYLTKLKGLRQFYSRLQLQKTKLSHNHLSLGLNHNQQLQSQYNSSVSQSVLVKFQKLILKGRTGLDQFWEIDADVAFNYKYYFADANIDNINYQGKNQINSKRKRFSNIG